MDDKSAILKHRRRFAMIAMAIISVCYFIWFTCSLESVGFIKFELFGSLTWLIFHALIVLSLIAINFSYTLHKSLLPLILGFVSTAVIIHAYHFEHDKNWHIEMAIGMGGFTIATIINFYKLKRQDKPE